MGRGKTRWNRKTVERELMFSLRHSAFFRVGAFQFSLFSFTLRCRSEVSPILLVSVQGTLGCRSSAG